ncbi:unnamed protein product [Candidula unifasciata]|uniref:Aprataxin and PNK-like factor n=1 Tax=Candidula unifasciata TaxID=100452 RepID=A0A8S3ZIU8_9EUPU|nr:unnamed protein product [Candidula unifasciata]
MQDITLQEVGGDLVINVPNESTVIGRGQFLQVTDKRVSRSHALLEVSDGKLYITPTHTNPCFLRTQNSKEQRALARDVKQHLDHGDEFGLLPDQFFYKVSYPQLNGKERNYNLTGGLNVLFSSEATEDLEKSRKSSTSSLNNEEEKDEKERSSEDESKEDNEPEKVTVEGQGDMTLPLKKKRALPDWMEKVAESPTKAKPPAKKQKAAPVTKKPGTKLIKPVSDDDNISEEEEEEEEQTSGKPSKGHKAKDSDEELEEEKSDDDYVPEKTLKKKGGKAQKKKRTSDSEDDISEDDDDDDYSPKKSKSKASKKTPKGKGSARAKKTPVRAPRSTPQRSRARKKGSDLDEDDDNEEALPRRRGRAQEEEESSLRRPQRAARQKRGSYVDDPMIEEALEDFASDNDNEGNEDKDSDFMVEGEEESGSDWEKSASSSQKQKTSKGKNKGPPKGPTKRVAASKKKKPRRASKAKDNSDEDDDEMEDDEPYVPRPSKRRGGTVSHESDESDEGGNKKKRRREPCQYGKKCYRKNPVHFRTFCHPGDSSYDEEDKDAGSPKEVSRKEKESRTGSEKPSRPQRSTAGTRLVTHGTEDGTADDNEEGIQRTDESGADDSDYVIEPEVQDRAKDVKKVQKNKKLAKPVESE